jgi:hypothetical protein
MDTPLPHFHFDLRHASKDASKPSILNKIGLNLLHIYQLLQQFPSLYFK